MAGLIGLMACGPMGGALNIAARSFSQSIHGTGAVASESAGSSAPYCLVIDARMVIARTPASLLTVHLPSLSNHWPPACRRIGLNWKAVHCEACIAHLNPWRVNFEPSLTVSRLATSPNCSHVFGSSLTGSRPTSLNCLVLTWLSTP